MKIHKESGVVIWYILAGVALFAALSFTFMRSANQSSGSMSKEQARIASSEILRYGESLKQAVQNLRLVAGCSENDLSFYTSGWATPSDYDNANNLFAGGNFDCFVFQKFGGGQSWSKLNDLALTGLSEGSYITSAFAIEDIGTAAPDLLLMVRGSPEVCTAVNSQAGIGSNTDAGNVVSSYTDPFTGSYTLVDTLGDAAAHADLAGQTYGCFTDAAGDFRNFYRSAGSIKEKMIQAAYQSQLKAQTLAFDPAQARAVDALQKIFMMKYFLIPRRSKAYGLSFKNKKYLKGLYLYGGVGRGKSMLMDLFYGELPATLPKRRCHFHEFMIETHNFYIRRGGKKLDHILPLYAAEVAQNCRVLCFDEFHVSDVADAMILGRLFGALFQEGVVVVTTSNRPPEELYKGGLQRDRFEPFVELLKRHMTILFLDSDTDYRQSFQTISFRQNILPHWVTRLITGQTGSFDLMCRGAAGSIGVACKGPGYSGRGRHTKSARFSFSQLCEQPLGAEDYLAIAQAYPSILLEDVPKLGYDRRNEAKRFMTLIDVLYDRKTDLYMTADAPPDRLYRGSHHSFEFERTVSRLLEMSAVQS